MQVQDERELSLDELFKMLEEAVAARDRERALQIGHYIEMRIADQAAEHIALEKRVQEALVKLDQEGPTGLLDLELGLKRGRDEGGDRDDDGIVFPVWFGTNRKPASDGVHFTAQRHDHVTHGRAEVYIPEAHRFGETGSSFWKRLKRFDLRDDRLRLQRVTMVEKAAFFGEVNEAVQDAREAGDTPHALVFLHGYKTGFDDAAIRAAQIGFDLKVTGATAFFSWPSRDSATAYTVDESSIEASESAITEFLVDFALGCKAEKVHVIAHSMGNRGLLRALQRIAGNAETRGKIRFGQIFLAAPDVDRDLFIDLARLYPEHSERTTLYASDGDKAVHASAKIHDAPRAGYFMPYTVAAGVDTVAVPDFDIDLLGHSYFSQAEALLTDMADLIELNRDPVKRRRVAKLDQDGLSLYRLRR